MISEERQDQAIAYIFGELAPVEKKAFEKELLIDPELQALLGQLQETLGHLAHAAPEATPPAMLKNQIMDSAIRRTEPVPVPKLEIPLRGKRQVPAVWFAVVAVLLIATVAAIHDAWATRAQSAAQATEIASLNSQLQTLQTNIDSQQQQIALLEQQNTLSKIQVASLAPQTPTFKQSNAVVIWNAAKQQGLLKCDRLPGAGVGKDYQLWLIDPANPAPVSAGTFAVGRDGTVLSTFKPVRPVSTVAKFAVSLEASGGSTAPQGPIVLVGG